MQDAEVRGKLARIVRYPVKGLPGIDAPQAELRPHQGLRHDRLLAIQRATTPVESPAGWSPRETFLHLAKDEKIAHLHTAIRDPESREAVLTLGIPDGHTIDVRLDPEGFDLDRPAADVLLRDILPEGPLGPPSLSRTGVNLWDWPQAHVSIINLASLRALGRAARAEIDRQRFRANLYVDLLEPWEEFALLGRRIRIGHAVLEVFQPTDRCRATTINPYTAESDLNIPGLLASRFGHMFCGVYARVVGAGRIAAGEAIEIDPADVVRVEVEGALREWPRAATILEKNVESPAVTSLWLRDSCGIAPTALPGQHVRVHVAGEPAPSWRCYTVSAVRDDAVRISVKRDGRVSHALHEALDEGDQILLTGPFGDVVLEEHGADVLLVSAGIGITPSVAMLRGLVASEARDERSRRVRVVHVDKVAGGVALWGDLLATDASLTDSQIHLFLTQEQADAADRVGAQVGRPDEAAWRKVLDSLDLEGLTVYACGPDNFVAEVRRVLTGLGVADEAISVEVFFSPTTAELTEPRKPSTTGPHSITIDLEDEHMSWSPESGSTLDTVEGFGIPWPSGCRVGACGTCAQRLLSGEVEYLSDPLSPPRPGHVLVCCSVPTSDVVFAASEPRQ